MCTTQKRRKIEHYDLFKILNEYSTNTTSLPSCKDGLRPIHTYKQHAARTKS